MTATTPAVLTAATAEEIAEISRFMSSAAVRKAFSGLFDTIDAQAAKIERLRGRIETLNWLCDFNNDAIAILTGQRDRARAALAPPAPVAAHRGRSAAPTDPAGTTP